MEVKYNTKVIVTPNFKSATLLTNHKAIIDQDRSRSYTAIINNKTITLQRATIVDSLTQKEIVEALCNYFLGKGDNNEMWGFLSDREDSNEEIIFVIQIDNKQAFQITKENCEALIDKYYDILA